MNSLKSAVMRFMRRWWWMLVSPFAAFFLVLFVALMAQLAVDNFREIFPGASPELQFLGIGFHGYILVAIATIGVPFAIWRGLSLQQQSEAASEQSNIAQSNLLDDRYQTGVEMLDSQVLSVRLGGIYALERVAENDPSTYHISTMSVLSAFIRNSHIKDEREGKRDHAVPDNEQKGPPEDVCTILEVIGRRSSKQHEIESERNYTVNLKGARLCEWRQRVPIFAPESDFSNVNFSHADLSQADLESVKFVRSKFFMANLSGAYFLDADFSHASFYRADLSGARFLLVNLSEADLARAKLSGTSLKKANGLTQEQINSAEIDKQRPPVLTDAVDAVTKQPLIVPLQSR